MSSARNIAPARMTAIIRCPRVDAAVNCTACRYGCNDRLQDWLRAAACLPPDNRNVVDVLHSEVKDLPGATPKTCEEEARAAEANRINGGTHHALHAKTTAEKRCTPQANRLAECRLTSRPRCHRRTVARDGTIAEARRTVSTSNIMARCQAGTNWSGQHGNDKPRGTPGQCTFRLRRSTGLLRVWAWRARTVQRTFSYTATRKLSLLEEATCPCYVVPHVWH
jgi:hypothetical protein